MRVAVILAALAIAVPRASAEQPIVKALTPAEKLGEARRLFRNREWQPAINQLKDLLYPTVSLSRREDIVEVHMLLGSSYYNLNNRQAAVAEYEKALELDFERGMTEVIHGEEAVKLFEETKERVRERIAAEAKRKEIAEREKRLREYIDTIGYYESRSWTQNLVPLGFPQSQNGHRTKALILGGGQAVFGAASLTAFLYLAGKYGLVAKVPLDEAPRAQRIQYFEIATGAAALGFYIISVIDGHRNYKPTTRIKGDDKLRELLDLDKPPETKPKPKKTSFRNSLRFAPLLSPDGVGIGVSWETD